MKAKTSPTSPKYKVECLEKLYRPESLKVIEKPAKKGLGWRFLVLALVFGFFAGFSGNFVFYYGLAGYPEFTAKILNVNAGQNSVAPQKIVANKNNFSDIRQNIGPSSVNIFVKKEGSENDLAGVYLPQDFAGQGLVLSSEGLIVTTKGAIDDFEKSYDVVTSAGKIYPAGDFIPDPATNLVFFKIDAENLKAAEISDVSPFLSGETGVVYFNSFNNKEEIIFTAEIEGLKDVNLTDQEGLVKTTESLDKYLAVAGSLGDPYEGCLLLDGENKVLALGTFKNQAEKNLFIPLGDIASVLSGILKEGAVLRPYLGVHYVDLSRALNISPVLSRDMVKGFLIYGSKEKPAVAKKSPAEKAGLKNGDIIIKINGEEIDDNFDFSRFIQGSKVGETLDLLINRDGQEKPVEVKLSTKS